MDVLLVVRNDLCYIYFVDVAQPFAMWACSLGRIERKSIRRWITVRYAGCWTHETLGEMLHFTSFVVHNHNKAFALFHGYLNGLLQTLVSTFDCQTVNHNLNVVGFIAVNLHAHFDFLYITVNSYM